MLVMALGIMAIVAGFSSGMVALSNASRTGTAGTLADRQMEAYRALPYSEHRAHGTPERRDATPRTPPIRRTTRERGSDRPRRCTVLDADVHCPCTTQASGRHRRPTAGAIASTRTSSGAARSARSPVTAASPACSGARRPPRQASHRRRPRRRDPIENLCPRDVDLRRRDLSQNRRNKSGRIHLRRNQRRRPPAARRDPRRRPDVGPRAAPGPRLAGADAARAGRERRRRRGAGSSG